MKLSLRLKWGISLAVLAVMLLSSSAWAAVVGGIMHRTRAHLVDGKARYDGIYAPVFYSIRPFFDAGGSNGDGTYTISIPAGKNVGWFNLKNRYIEEYPVKTFQERQEFVMWDLDGEYYIVDEEYEDFHKNREYYSELTTNAEEVIPSSKFSAAIKSETFFKDIPYSSFYTTKQQINAKCVPYIELVTTEGKVTGLRWRFVDPAKPDVALTRSANSNITSIWDFTIWTKEYPHSRMEDISFYPKEGDSLEGALLNLKQTYPLEQVGRVSVRFGYDIKRNSRQNF